MTNRTALLKRAVFSRPRWRHNENRPDYVRVGGFAFLPDVFDPLRRLASRIRCVVVQQQSAIGRGLCEEKP